MQGADDCLLADDRLSLKFFNRPEGRRFEACSARAPRPRGVRRRAALQERNLFVPRLSLWQSLCLP
jgi:hypothetical protein